MKCGSYSIILVALAGACRHPDPGGAVESSASSSGDEKRLSANRVENPNNRVTACVVPMDEVAAPQASKADSCPLASEPAPSLPMGRVLFEDAPRKPRVEVELAQTDSSRQRGLMYRTRMGEYQGMLFSWSDETPRSFWMHNTCLPLDMLFIAQNGTIAGVLEQVPVLNDEPRGIPCPVAHVLELNAGWVRAHGVKPGQQITISAL